MVMVRFTPSSPESCIDESMAMASPWSSEIPEELLHLIIDRLVSTTSSNRPGLFSTALSQLRRRLHFSFHGFKKARRDRHSSSADRARFRAVCRSWHLAMSRQAPRHVPWIVMSDGSLLTPSDTAGKWWPARIPSLPRKARCVASADSWLLLDCCTDVRKKMHSYSLHDPFTKTTVPLPELDAVIGCHASKLFQVRKLRLRTTPYDIIVVMTNNWNYPVILIRPGKGVWLPKTQTAPFIYIVDTAFLGDKLYGITHAEDLVSCGIDFDSNGVPTITTTECLIRRPHGPYWFPVWSGGDDSTNNDHGNMVDKVTNNKKPSKEYHQIQELRNKTGDDMVHEGVTGKWWEDEVPDECEDGLTADWYLVESCGKLLMVIRHIQWPASGDLTSTPKVEVYEADVNKGAHCWVPISGGLGSQTLFISNFFCKSISTCDEADQDAIHFIDTGEKYNMKYQTMSRTWRDIKFAESMWIFSPELVV